MSKTTISDIAKMAGVSKSTVSRYLNNGYVSEMNREKIKQAMEKTNYQANFFAQALNADKSGLVGVIIPRYSSFTANQMLEGIAEGLKENGYEMFIASSNLSAKEELKQIEKFITMGVDGIISLTTHISAKHQALSQASKIPILFLGQTAKGVHCLAIDDYGAGKMAADYLRNKDFKKILYLGVSEKDEAVGYYRKKGFIDHINRDVIVLESDFSFEKAYQLGEKIMTYDVDVVVCTTDNMAIGLLRYLLEQDIAVPETLSVLSFGGYDVSAAIHPPLTTIAIDYQGLGKKASDYLFALIEDPQYQVKSDLFKAITLIERSSVKE